ncbi:MAG: transketolase [Chloroflexi bacterium]|nr:MAG: transketolase [Chloroflexota bacterium]
MIDADKKQGAEEADLHVSPRVMISPAEVLQDYSLAVQSRQASLIGRREVLSGKAKFGIFGDGKEIAQIALAKAFRKGDFRSGYYRDQTWMFALGINTIQQYFAQLYAHADVRHEPNSGGRQMNAHFATRSLDKNGRFLPLTEQYNSSADISPTGSQMPRLVGLGYASRLYRELEELHQFTEFSHYGDEIAWGTIGNASTAEGMFWEAVNAIGVLKAPVIISIWDDGYGISVPNEHQVTKENLSEVLSGFQREPGSDEGYDLYTVRGWDYPALIETYQKAAETVRRDHVPAIVHVVEVTQPQGHSTSGSHERYKSEERMAFEREFDCLARMRQWIIEERMATAGELDQIERNAKKLVENTKVKAWKAFTRPFFVERDEALALIQAVETNSAQAAGLADLRHQLLTKQTPYRRDILTAVHHTLILTRHEPSPARQQLVAWRERQIKLNNQRIGSDLHEEEDDISALNVVPLLPVYEKDAPQLPGFKILNQAFDAILARDPRVLAFGEDVGQLGGVNQSFAGLQKKYGLLRVSDTGIREVTILGQAIGMAMRGLRPIAEIQYLDYLLYALQIMSDDLATVSWRTAGGQKAPVIVRTRGHRLEGVWHSGSPMGAVVHLLRGMHVAVPRNMVQAVGFYNTLLAAEEPGLIVEVLSGYRLKERVPANLADIRIPLGEPMLLRPGDDVTLVTYGAGCRLGLSAAELLAEVGISLEVIDVQTLLPFDRNGRLLESLQKTSRIVFMDEDVPGGATAYMMQQVIEKQGGYHWLDSEPRTLTAKPHRPAFGTDGNYFSKPNVQDVFDVVYELMHEVDPASYPEFYQ